LKTLDRKANAVSDLVRLHVETIVVEPGAAAARFKGAAPAPERSSTTAQGHPRTIFNRTVEKGSLVIAEATAREIQPLTLAEALELTALVARKEPRRFDGYAVRWLSRYLETESRTLHEAEVVVRCFAALPGGHHDQALPGAAAVRGIGKRRP
jgi:hypothetical protein